MDYKSGGVITLEMMPEFDLFLSQVLEFLNSWFPEEKYTHNIVQNYIKSGIITRPVMGKKRGYKRMHIIQLIMLSYLRPVLSGDEIRDVFSLAFNEINEADDDIITWEDAYTIFLHIREGMENGKIPDERSYANMCLKEKELDEKDRESLVRFISILILTTRAGDLKKKALNMIYER